MPSDCADGGPKTSYCAANVSQNLTWARESDYPPDPHHLAVDPAFDPHFALMCSDDVLTINPFMR